MLNTTAGSSNTAVGTTAMRNGSGAGSNITAIGYNAALSVSTGNITAVGSGAGIGLTTGVANVAIGYGAGAGNATGNNNTAVGYASWGPFAGSAANDNTVIGYNAGYFTKASGNTLVGSNVYGTGADPVSGPNTAIGFQSQYQNNPGINNTSVGYRCFGSLTMGVRSVTITNGGSGYTPTPPVVAFSGPAAGGGGLQAMGGTVIAGGIITGVTITNRGSFYSTTPVATVAFTGGSGTGATGTVIMNAISLNNTGLGHDVAFDMKEGSNNTIIGYNSGRGITTGSNNTFLGGSITGLPATLDSTVIISDGTGSARLYSPSSGNILFGTTTDVPSAKVAISSTTQGFLLPRMTGVQAEAIASKAEGSLVYATDGTGAAITSKGWWGWDGAAWAKLN
jgi:hypothetical protein